MLLQEAAEKDAPEALFWVLGVLVPFGFLLAWALVKPRGGGH
jgi:hypothetical protein